MASMKKFLKEKRWALIAIGLGTIIGFGSAILCIAWNLVIFGFNIMYIVSPLLAGFIETVIASKKYGRSTGAISALLTFFLINGYGWFGPGWIFPKEPVTLSLITIIAIVLTLQAAFPILVNYILFVVVVGTFTRIMRPLLNLPAKISRKIPKNPPIGEFNPPADEVFLDGLTIPLVSVHPVNGGKILKYMGLVVGEAVAQEKESEGRISNLLKIIEPIQLGDMNLGEARKAAMSRMLEEAESLGANGVEEVLIDYVFMGGLQGSATIVNATGTAVMIQEGTSKSGENGSEEDFISETDEINDSGAIEPLSNSVENISALEEKIKENARHTVPEDVSYRIEQYIYEKNNPPLKDWKQTAKNELDQFEMKYSKILDDLERMDQRSQEWGVYTNKKINKMYDNVSLAHKSDYDTKRIKGEIIGKEVVDANARVIGKVKEVDVNSQTKKVKSLIVGKNGILGSMGRFNDIVIPQSMVLSMGDRIVLKTGKQL